MAFDPKLIGIALSGGQGEQPAYLQGQMAHLGYEKAMEEAAARKLDLALKESIQPYRQAIEFSNMMSKLSVPNEQRIAQGISLATDPFASVTRVQGIGPYNEDPEVARLRKVLNTEKPTGYATDPEIGIGGRTIRDSYQQGAPQEKPRTMEERQQLSIDKLRGQAGRSPQSVDSIVQPLEGDLQPLPGQVVQGFDYPRQYQGQAVDNKEPIVIPGNPDEEAALSYVMGKLADLRDPENEQAFSAMNNPVLQRRMLGAMLRAGYVPGLGIQTDSTEKRLAAIDQGQIMSAKSATKMSQEAEQFQMKMEEQRLLSFREELLKMQSMANDRGLKQESMTLERKMKEVDQKLRAMEIITRPPPGSRKSASDPLQKAYIDRLKASESTQQRFLSKLANEYGVLQPHEIKSIIKSDPQSLADYNQLGGLWWSGEKYPAARAVFEDFFRGGYKGDLNELFSDARPSTAGTTNGEAKTTKANAAKMWSKADGPPQAGMKTTIKGKTYTFNGTKWE